MNETVKSTTSAVNKANSRKNRPSRRTSGYRNGWHLLAGAGCLLSLLALCLVSISLWKQQQIVTQLEHHQQALRQQGEQSRTLLAKNSKILEELQKQLSDNVRQTLSVAKSLQKIQGNGEENWNLVEAEYLLRAANIQLQTSQDVSGAMRLLKQANEIVNGINDYALFPVRKGLEEDITALNGASVVDITGIWLQLNAVIAQVQQLPLLTPEGFDAGKALSESQKGTIEENATPSGWLQHVKRVLLDSWHFFSRQFYLRKHNSTQPAVLISAKDEIQLRQNLQLMLSQAQQALLIRDETIYRQILNDIVRWINIYFRNNSPEAKALLAKLDYLKKRNIAPVMPDITHGVTALDAYNNQKTSPLNNNSNAEQGNSLESITAEHKALPEAKEKNTRDNDESTITDKPRTSGSEHISGQADKKTSSTTPEHQEVKE